MTTQAITIVLNWLSLVAFVASFVMLVMGLLVLGMVLGRRQERAARANTMKHQAVYVGGKVSNAAMPLVRRASRVETGKPPKVWRGL